MLPLTEWRFHLVDSSVNANVMPGIDDDAGKVVILTEDTPDSPSIYTDATGTALTETAGVAVLGFTNGEIRFWTANTVTALDLSGITNLGQTFALNSVTPSQQMIPINSFRSNQLLVVPFGNSNNVETDTGFDLPANCLINPEMGMAVRVTTIDATENLDIGILSSESGGDADGFVTQVSVGTSGFVAMLPLITNGATIDFTAATTVGALLASAITGSDVVATCGGFQAKTYRTDGTAKSISWTETAGGDTLFGYFYLPFVKLPF